MPQNSAVDGEGVGVDVIVEVAASGVTEISEDELEEGNVEESLEDKELEKALLVVSLADVDSGARVEDEALLEIEELAVEELKVEELKAEDLEAEDLAEDTTASHFPNPAWQPVPQYALPLPQ